MNELTQIILASIGIAVISFAVSFVAWGLMYRDRGRYD